MPRPTATIEPERRLRIAVLRAELSTRWIPTIRRWFSFSAKRPVTPSPGASVKDGEIILPSRTEFAQLDEVVRKIGNLIRTTEPRDLSECYRALNRHRRTSNLEKHIFRAIERAKMNVPSRPMESFFRMKGVEGQIGRLAEQFIHARLEMFQGSRKPSSIEWEPFAALFLQHRNEERKRRSIAGIATLNTLVPKAVGGPELVAYCVYLEIECEDRAWMQTYADSIYPFKRWLDEELENPKMVGILDDAFAPWILSTESQMDLDERSATRCRDSAKQRKRKHRAKIADAKSVTD